jgi:hypothetical protein
MTDIKIEEASDTREEQDPLLISSPEIRAGYEVSHIFASLLLCSVHRYSELCIVSFSCQSVCLYLCLSACLPACMKGLNSTEWILKISLVKRLVSYCTLCM